MPVHKKTDAAKTARPQRVLSRDGSGVLKTPRHYSILRYV